MYILNNIYAPIYIYVSLTIFFILMLQYVNNNNASNNSELLRQKQSLFFKTNWLLFVGSLIGVPPLLGFIAKLLIFTAVLSGNNVTIMCVVLFLNAYLMVFYLQQFKFNQINKKKTNVVKSFTKTNTQAYLAIILFQFVNVAAVFLSATIAPLLF